VSTIQHREASKASNDERRPLKLYDAAVAQATSSKAQILSDKALKYEQVTNQNTANNSVTRHRPL